MRIPLLLTVFLPHSTIAENATWNGTIDTLWSTVGNWSATPSPVPGTTEAATFDNPGNGRTTIGLGAGITLKSLVSTTADAIILNNTAPISSTGQFLPVGLNGNTGLSGINGKRGIIAVGNYFRIPGLIGRDNPQHFIRLQVAESNP